MTATEPKRGATRPPWDQYFMKLARVVAERGTCNRKQVGCVIVARDKTVLATGYNGSLKGTPHCDDAGHLIVDNHCVRTVHAETNAVSQAARRGTSLGGSIAYVTCAPCPNCFKVLVSAGVERVVFGEPYRNERLFDEATEAGIQVEELKEEP